MAFEQPSLSTPIHLAHFHTKLYPAFQEDVVFLGVDNTDWIISERLRFLHQRRVWQKS